MTITLSYNDLLLTVLVILAAAAIVYLIIVLNRISGLLSAWKELGDSIKPMVPRIRRIVENTDETLAGTRRTLKNVELLSDEAVAIASSARRAVKRTAAVITPLRIVLPLVVKLQQWLAGVVKRRKLVAKENQSKEENHGS